jgi:hypothetical protein
LIFGENTKIEETHFLIDLKKIVFEESSDFQHKKTRKSFAIFFHQKEREKRVAHKKRKENVFRMEFLIFCVVLL